MNGPAHYVEAERLATQSYHYTYGDGGDAAVGHALAALAKVHATLALAATQATSLINTPDVIASEVIDAWQRVTS